MQFPGTELLSSTSSAFAATRPVDDSLGIPNADTPAASTASIFTAVEE
jgi:hypothetical protein